MLPSGPVWYQVGIGDQHSRCVFVGFENANWFARLHQQGFVVVQFFQAGDDLVETFPIACGAAYATVYHQFFWVFRHIRVEVVHQHAQWRFGQP